MKNAILFFPNSYIGQVIKLGLERNGLKVSYFSGENEKTKIEKFVYTKTKWLPEKYTNFYNEPIIARINKEYLKIANTIKPDLIIIYNSRNFLPDTIRKLKFYSKVGIYLADNPFYTHTNKYNLALLPECDFVISPDSFWSEQLRSLGIKNIYYDIFGYSSKFFNGLTPVHKRTFVNDLLFIGSSYSNSWGFKRCMFLDQFSELDLKIYGDNSWQIWLKDFPNLQNKFQLKKKYLSNIEMQNLLQSAKIYPIDSNPGILNGLHIRIFDCIGQEILPIVEYKRDIDIIFNGVDLPVIRNYSEGAEKAITYIENNFLREKKIHELKKYINARYETELTSKRLLKWIQ